MVHRFVFCLCTHDDTTPNILCTTTTTQYFRVYSPVVFGQKTDKVNKNTKKDAAAMTH